MRQPCLVYTGTPAGSISLSHRGSSCSAPPLFTSTTMSTDHHTPNLIPSDDGNDKDDQATPLDILLNAITGTSDQYPYTEQDDPTNETVQDEELNLQGFLQAQPPHHADVSFPSPLSRISLISSCATKGAGELKMDRLDAPRLQRQYRPT